MVVFVLEILQLHQLSGKLNCLRLSFDFCVIVQPLVNCCFVILALTSSDVCVMLGCGLLKCVQYGTRDFDLFGLFVVSPCDECVSVGQQVPVGPTTHLSYPECYFKSLHLRLIHVVYCCCQMRFQEEH